MRVEVRSKVISTSFLKIKGRGDSRWGGRLEKEGKLVELAGVRNPGPEASPRSKTRRERRE